MATLFDPRDPLTKEEQYGGSPGYWLQETQPYYQSDPGPIYEPAPEQAPPPYYEPPTPPAYAPPISDQYAPPPAPAVDPLAGFAPPQQTAAPVSDMRSRVENELRQILESSGQVDLNASEFAPIRMANDAAAQRSRRRQQASAAERYGAMGLGRSGAMNRDVQRSWGDYAKQTAGFDAGLVVDRAKQRKNQIMQALQIGQGVMDSDLENQLRSEMARLDAQVAQSDMALKRQLGISDVGLRRYGIDLGASQGSAANQFDQQQGTYDINSQATKYLMGLMG